MKKLIVCLVAVASFVFSANAQETRKTALKEHHHEKKGMMMKELNLTTSQKEQLKSQRLETKNQMMELNKMDNISVKEYKERKAAIQKTQKDKMNSVLTTEQKSKLKQIGKERKESHEKLSAQRFEKMKKRLNLSDEQAVNIKASQDAYQAQAKAIRENDKLSKMERKEKLMALHQENKGSIKKFLTPDQLKKIEEHKKGKMEKESSK